MCVLENFKFSIIRRGLEFSQWSMPEGKCDGLSWQLWRWKWARQVRMLLSTGVELNLTQVQDRWAKATVITATHSKAYSSMRAHWAEKISCQRKMFSIFQVAELTRERSVLGVAGLTAIRTPLAPHNISNIIREMQLASSKEMERLAKSNQIHIIFRLIFRI